MLIISMEKLIISFLAFFLSSNLLCKEILLKDVPYSFDTEKVQAAKNSFHFLRSFVEYYYLLIKVNKDQLPEINSRWGIVGWCAGDAHPENFGVLIGENNNRTFTINDWDDSGPCPVYLDLFRLLVSSKLYDSSLNLEEILSAYKLGLSGGNLDQPNIIQGMFRESEDRGTTVNPKKINGNLLLRNAETAEVSSDERKKIESAVGFSILDIIKTAKQGGGSGGLERFEILVNIDGKLTHLELKNEIDPGISPIQTAKISTNSERFNNSFFYFGSNNISKLYKMISINGQDFLVRPRFYGNVGVNLNDTIDFKSSTLISYEAFILGTLHQKSISSKNLMDIEISKINDEVNSFVKKFQSKFNELKK